MYTLLPETRDKMSEVIDELKGGELSGIICAWIVSQSGKKLYDVLYTRFEMEIVMAELEYGKLGFLSDAGFERPKKKKIKKEIAKMDEVYFVDGKCRENISR